MFAIEGLGDVVEVSTRFILCDHFPFILVTELFYNALISQEEF